MRSIFTPTIQGGNCCWLRLWSEINNAEKKDIAIT